MTPKVLFIAAHSRSGSTILDRVLAQVDGAFTAGELRYIWQRSFIEDQLCGCNTPFKQCPIWSEVIKESGITSEHVEVMIDASRNVDRFKKIPLVMKPAFRSQEFGDKLNNYLKNICEIYNSIYRVASPDFIIDSSKSPNYGILLSQIQGITLHVLHLVRDSRAVAFSRLRRKKRPEIHWKDEYMAITSPYKTALEWNLINYAIGTMKTGVSYSLVRYEDFMENPRSTVMRILEEMNIGGKDISFIKKDLVELKTDHTVSGNPMRFKTGTIQLKLDDQWKAKLARRYKVGVKLLTLPLLKKYGYV